MHLLAGVGVQMDERRWFETDDLLEMLKWLSENDKLTPRLVALLKTAFCRCHWDLIPDRRSRHAVRAAEQHANGRIDTETLWAANALATVAIGDIQKPPGAGPYVWMYGAAIAEKASRTVSRTFWKNELDILRSAASVSRYVLGNQYRLNHEYAELARNQHTGENHYQTAERLGGRILCRAVREIIGNPFNPLVIAPTWRTEPVLLLARQIELETDFDQMPLLAEHLEAAGCDDGWVLSHYLNDHYQGCWLLDAILERRPPDDFSGD